MGADEKNYLEQHNNRDVEKVKELRPDDNSEIAIKWISPAIIIIFFSLLAIVGLIVGDILFTVIMTVSALLIVSFIRIFGGYCLRKSRPYVIMKDGIEIPEKYTSSGEREKVKYKDVTKIQYEKSNVYGKVPVIRTVSDKYIIRGDMSKKVLRALPRSVIDKFQKKKEKKGYPDYGEEEKYHDYEEIKDSLPKLARKYAEMDNRFKNPKMVVRTLWKLIFAIIAPLAILIYFDPIILGWIMVSIVIVIAAIHLILIEYPLYKYYKNGPEDDYRRYS